MTDDTGENMNLIREAIAARHTFEAGNTALVECVEVLRPEILWAARHGFEDLVISVAGDGIPSPHAEWVKTSFGSKRLFLRGEGFSVDELSEWFRGAGFDVSIDGAGLTLSGWVVEKAADGA